MGPLLWIVYALTALVLLAAGEDAVAPIVSFEFEGELVEGGTQKHFLIELADDWNRNTTIPCVIFHGVDPGPVLGITAGVHGFEYSPILAGQRLLKELNSTALKGTVVLVLIANPPSFLGRSPYVNPLDHENLNRVFPGTPNGSLTFRMADWITEKVIQRCDFFVDMHSGDAPEDLMPYAAYYHGETPDKMDSNAPDYAKASVHGRAIAASMGFEHVVVFNTSGQDYIQPNKSSLYCSAQAFKLGIPAVDIECGRLGRVEPQFVDQIVSAIQRLLGHLNMTDTSFEQQADYSATTTFIHTRSFLESSHAGVWYPAHKAGDLVEEGEILGHITDFFGHTLEEVRVDASGVILYILGTPPVNPGDSLVSIGILERDDTEV